MTNAVELELERFKTLTMDERDELFTILLDDPELRADLMDAALALEAEAQGGTPVSLEDYLAGKRTY